MVADDLALALADRYVEHGAAVLDPFCGSGRLLAAAARVPGRRVGFDANPLACLLTRARLANPDPGILTALIDDIHRVRSSVSNTSLRLRNFWKVEWFPPATLAELSQIIDWINRAGLEEPERLIVAAAISGAARDASYARKDSWKLHRLNADARNVFRASAWDSFERRLCYCVAEVLHEPMRCTETLIEVRDARTLASLQSRSPEMGVFDVILTSPPYGDSRTTVQYGSASALCLEFASRIVGLEDLFATGRSIDAICLGGRRRSGGLPQFKNLHPYWAGRMGTPLARAIAAFLQDYHEVCTGIASCLKPGGTAVLVVGQRSTGGYRLKLDRFTVDCFEMLGLRTIAIERRRLREKHLPRRINRYARSASPDLRAKGLTSTISNEIILSFRKDLS
jgi:site-specific DNA-methyltransferase (cytosine-N4-specific)